MLTFAFYLLLALSIHYVVILAILALRGAKVPALNIFIPSMLTSVTIYVYSLLH